MKDFVFTCLGICCVITIIAFIFGSVEYNSQKELLNVGDSIVLNKDTLIITKIDMFNKTYLHNGAIIDTNFAIECLEK